MPSFLIPQIGERVLDLGGASNPALIERSADPLVNFGAPLTPIDFAAQFPTPLDTTEIIAMCEEVTVLNWLMTLNESTGLKETTWQELNELAFTSGSSYISFNGDVGECPEEYKHDGDPTTVALKWVGAKKTLGISDIMHSAASRAAGYGIRALNGPTLGSEMMPGAGTQSTMLMETVADLKEKEVKLGMTLVLNGLDNLMVNGDHTQDSLQFDGIVKQLSGTDVHYSSVSGSFSANSFDRFLSEGCAKPQVLVGAPQAIQELLMGYLSLGFQGAQIVSINEGSQGGNRIVPGFNFASAVNTGIGRLPVVADTNFSRTDSGGGKFSASIYGLRMTHNGAKMVYPITQIPVSMNDLTPGCTTIAFQIIAKLALIIKHKCAHHRYTTEFTGKIVTTCPVIL